MPQQTSATAAARHETAAAIGTPSSSARGMTIAMVAAVTDVAVFLTVPSTHGLARCCVLSGMAIHSIDLEVLLSDQRRVRSSMRPTKAAVMLGLNREKTAEQKRKTGDESSSGIIPRCRIRELVPKMLMSDESSPAAA
eukprot:scaffold9452_cov48-Phaeocystis_antarctica.AAC.2